MIDSLAGVPQFSDARYADLAVGDRWGPFIERLRRDTSDALRGAIGTQVAGESAPLGVLPLRVLRRSLDGIIPGGVLARQTFSVVDELPAEGDVAIEMWVSGRQWRPSGLYTTFTFSFACEGRLAAAVEWMIIAPPRENDLR